MYSSAIKLWRWVEVVCLGFLVSKVACQYTVVPGDSLWSIAQAHGIPLSLLEAENPQIPDFDLIYPGEIINLPLHPGGQHIVVEGDTLYNLAIVYNVDLTCLEDGNPQIADPNLIFPGDVINIPANCPPFNPAELPTTITRITQVTTTSLISTNTSPKGTTTLLTTTSVMHGVIGGTYTIGSSTFTVTDSDKTSGNSDTLPLPSGSPVTGPTIVTINGTVGPAPSGSSAPRTRSASTPNVITLTGTSGNPITLTLSPGSSITGPTTVTTNGQTFTVSPAPNLSSTPRTRSASTPNVITLTGTSGNPITLTLSPGSSIIGPTTVTTNGQTFTVSPAPNLSSTPRTRSASTPNVITLTGTSGNPITLTLSPGSSITGPTTVTTNGQTFTVSPAPNLSSTPRTTLGGSPTIFITTATDGSVETETFAPTTYPGFASLTSTTTITSTSSGVPIIIPIGPGGTGWVPIGGVPPGSVPIFPPLPPPVGAPEASSGSLSSSTSSPSSSTSVPFTTVIDLGPIFADEIDSDGSRRRARRTITKITAIATPAIKPSVLQVRENLEPPQLQARAVGKVTQIGTCPLKAAVTFPAFSKFKGAMKLGRPDVRNGQGGKNGEIFDDIVKFYGENFNTDGSNFGLIRDTINPLTGKPSRIAQNGSIDHVYEKSLIADFLASQIGADFTCDDFNKLFFTCKDNILQQIYNQLPSMDPKKPLPGFAAMNQNLNGFKGWMMLPDGTGFSHPKFNEIYDSPDKKIQGLQRAAIVFTLLRDNDIVEAHNQGNDRMNNAWIGLDNYIANSGVTRANGSPFTLKFADRYKIFYTQFLVDVGTNTFKWAEDTIGSILNGADDRTKTIIANIQKEPKFSRDTFTIDASRLRFSSDNPLVITGPKALAGGPGKRQAACPLQSTSQSSTDTSTATSESTTMITATSTKVSPPSTIQLAPSMTINPTGDTTCQPIGLRDVQANGVVTIPSGDTGIIIDLPFADVVSGTWTATISGGFAVDPKTLITFWRVDTGPGSLPFGSDNGGANINIQWSNPTGRTGTQLELVFKSGIDGILSFGIQVNGAVGCTPESPTPPVSSTPSPTCPEPVPTAPSVGGQEQDLVCTDTNLASRTDCLGLLPLLSQGSSGGITAADCVPGSAGTNAFGQMYCSWATNRSCSLVAVFGDANAQQEPQSRDDIAAIINNSNMFCFRVCDSGPLEGSQIYNQMHNVRVCIIETDSAAEC